MRYRDLFRFAGILLVMLMISVLGRILVGSHTRLPDTDDAQFAIMIVILMALRDKEPTA